MHGVSDSVGLIDRFTSIPGMPALLLYLAAAAVPVILLHELGHALVASRRLGGPVHISVVGTGTLLSIRIKRIRLDVSALSHAAEPPSPTSLDAVRASARGGAGRLMSGGLFWVYVPLRTYWLVGLGAAVSRIAP